MLKEVLALSILASASSGQTPARDAESLCPEAIRMIDASAAKTLAQGSPGMVVAVAQHGQPRLIKGYGQANLEYDAPMAASTVFKLASATKQFTAAAILQLAEEGRLSLDQTLSAYVPELPQAKQITLYQLLVQTSGIPDYAADPIGTRTKSVAKTSEEMLAWIGALKPALQFEPGSRWGYSNSNYALLGIVLERVERKPLAAIFRDRLFARAGLAQTAFDDQQDIVPGRAEGYRLAGSGAVRFRKAEWISYTVPGAAGGLRTDASDLIKWEHALFSGRIVTPASLRKLTSPGFLNDGKSTKSGMPIEWQTGLNADYGMGVFITPRPVGLRIWHSGDIDGFSTWLAHYPDQDVTIVLMINSESADMDKDEIEKAAFAGLAC